MIVRLMTGNEALALGAVHAGVKVVTGYPGTPSTGALASLLETNPAGVHVEWSTNEKVAFEIAAGAAWAGQRALCTMKMSGLNVAYDSLISIAYSGVVGGLVIYVADDPGVSAGMAEQDSRGFALMSDLPMLDPVSVARCLSPDAAWPSIFRKRPARRCSSGWSRPIPAPWRWSRSMTIRGRMPSRRRGSRCCCATSIGSPRPARPSAWRSTAI